MSAATMLYRELIDRLPSDSTLILRKVGWDDYEALLAEIVEAPGIRVSYDRGTLQIMTISWEHEKYGTLIERLVALLSARLRVKVLFFGSSTMTRERKSKGAEPDACFYVQSAGLIAGKSQLDLRSDPPPDVVVEIDLRHESHSKLPLYAGLGVPEVWRYDGEAVTIFRLQEEQYVPAAASVALPMLSAEILTRFLNLSRDKDQYEVTLAFEEWLDTLR